VELAAVLLACVVGMGVFISLRACSITYPLTLVWALIAVLIIEDRALEIRLLAGVSAVLCAMITGMNVVVRVLRTAENRRAVKAEKSACPDPGTPDTAVHVE
jgi:hypothetical protein